MHAGWVVVGGIFISLLSLSLSVCLLCYCCRVKVNATSFLRPSNDQPSLEEEPRARSSLVHMDYLHPSSIASQSYGPPTPVGV